MGRTEIINQVLAIGICGKHYGYRGIRRMSGKANTLFVGEIVGMEEFLKFSLKLTLSYESVSPDRTR